MSLIFTYCRTGQLKSHVHEKFGFSLLERERKRREGGERGVHIVRIAVQDREGECQISH
jgi:hypothetical protein